MHSNSGLYYLCFTCISHDVWIICVCSCREHLGVAGLIWSAFLGRPRKLCYTYSWHVQVAIPEKGARLLMGSKAFWQAIPLKQSVKNMSARSAREVPTALQMVAVKGEAQLHTTILVVDLLPASLGQLWRHQSRLPAHAGAAGALCTLQPLCLVSSIKHHHVILCSTLLVQLSRPCLLWQCTDYTGLVNQ